MSDVAALTVESLTKVFHVRGPAGGTEELRAVDGVSFAVPSCGSMAVVGESGSGKTTVARIVAGLETATSGSVKVGSADRASRPRGRAARRDRARQAQMVFQDPYQSLDPRQTAGASIAEVLAVNLDLNGEQRRGRVLELLDQVGLEARHAQARPGRLSGGQRQRVAIARALALQPRLLILDEAVSALDVSVQAQVLNLLIDLRANLDVALLFISHDLGVVRQISDSCIVMHEGRIVEEGPTERTLDDPQDAYTRRLLEAIPRPGWRPRRRDHAAAG